jgi:aconitate hydratase
MGLGIFQKIIKNHLVEGKMISGGNIGIKIDQNLIHDGTGMLVYLELESMGITKIQTETAVCYIDHGLLQSGFMNADNHKFLQSASSKYGAYFSLPGNGICHQLHLERFAKPGQILLGADSHTPTSGAVGMIAIGGGGLDIALVMSGEPFRFRMPKIVNILLKGKLNSFVSAKDIILYLLKRLTVKGGINKVFEYSGSGVETLNISQRATIANMGTELGTITSIFPSDKMVFKFMQYQNREIDWIPIEADKDSVYNQTIEIDLENLEPLIAQPHSPDNVVKIKNITGEKVDQVAIGSCTNSSFEDLMKVALMLKGKKIHPGVEVALNPGSRQVLREMTKTGALDWLLSAGVRILEVGCGPCIGMGFSPSTNGVSLRTYNRNFLGRSGTKSAQVYLVSPESAAAAAITGVITDPRDLGLELPEITIEEKCVTNDSMILSPSIEPEKVKLIKGPNIVSLPLKEPLEEKIEADIQLKLGDNITTDDILPGGAEVLPLRANLPKSAEYAFISLDSEFVCRMKKQGKGILVGGLNYGQGSSREMAAFVCMCLGVKAVIAKSFSRIHHDNLINSGVLPLIFERLEDYDRLEQGDLLEIKVKNLESNMINIKNKTKKFIFIVKHELTNREKEIIKAGGTLPYYRNKRSKED